MTLAQFQNCIDGYGERKRNEFEMLATHALWVRVTTLTNPKKRMKLTDLISFGGRGHSVKSVKDMSEQERAELKQRLRANKEFFDMHPHPDMIYEDTMNG